MRRSIQVLLLCMGITNTTVIAQEAVEMTHVGKLYFSNMPFTSSHAGAKSSFKSTDAIYGRLEMDGGKKLYEVAEGGDKFRPDDIIYLYYWAEVTKNGGRIGGLPSKRYIRLMPDQWHSTAINFDVLPEPEKATTTVTEEDRNGDFSKGPVKSMPAYECIAGWSLNDPIKDAGTYTVKVALYAKNSSRVSTWPTCDGSFEWTLDPADADALVKRAVDSRDAIIGKAAKIKVEAARQDMDVRTKAAADKLASTPTPPEWNAKSSPFAGGVTMQVVKHLFAQAMPGFPIMKVYVAPTASAGWLVQKNDLGIPLYKYTDQTIIIFFHAGEACRSLMLDVRKQYEGGGKYGGYIYGTSNWTELPCDKLK